MRRFASLSPLAERQFQLLFLGRFVSFVGSAFAPVAIAFAVLQVGSASDLGLVLAANMLPTVVFVLVGGVIADCLPRRGVLVASNVMSGAAQALFAVLIASGHAQLWELVAIRAVRGMSVLLRHRIALQNWLRGLGAGAARHDARQSCRRLRLGLTNTPPDRQRRPAEARPRFQGLGLFGGACS
jgi:MFS family permease